MRIGVPSFRTRILIMVFTVAVVPMALMGLWLTRSASRSGQELLHSRLEQALDRSAERIGDNWLRQRSDILFLGEDDTVQRALLAETGGTATREVPATLRRQFEDLDVSVLSATILDLTGQELWTLTRNLAPRDPGPALGVEFPIYRRFPARELGKLEVRLALEGLIEDAGMWPEARRHGAQRHGH